MRSRNIKPGFFKNEKLAECSIPARLLFIGLWCMADRKGRLQDRPKKIKMEIFPADSFDCEKLLDELADCELIVRYEVSGKHLIWIPKFLTHQNPHRREAESQLPPAPCDPEAQIIDQDNDMDRPRTGQGTTKDMTSPADSLIPDSLIPDSLIPDSNNKQQQVKPEIDSRSRDPGKIPQGRIVSLFFKVFGRHPNGFERPELVEFALSYPGEVVEYAFREAGENGASSLKYIQKILEEYDSHGIRRSRPQRKTDEKTGTPGGTEAPKDWAGDMPAVGVG